MAQVKVNGISLNFESIRIEHSQDETILIFLHEALGSIPQWRSFPTELCHQVGMNGIVYERQGHGKSDPLDQQRNADYLHDYAWRELPSFLDAILAPEQKVILIGHSDGGTIALLYAAKFIKRVKAVVTMAAHVINEPETIAGIAPAVHAFQSGKLNKLHDFHGHKTEALFFAWADTWNSNDFLNWNICSDIRSVKAPCLILQGNNDQYGTVKQLELIQDSVSGICKTMLIRDCGHHPHLEKPNEIIQLISTFLKDQF
jgi:pimeloyl-ACP methyl ester carboxylesterase